MTNRECACTASRIEYVPPEDNGGMEAWRCSWCGATFRKMEQAAPTNVADLRRAAEEAFDLSYLDEGKLYLAWGVLKRKVIPVMKTWLLELWTDPAKFRAAVRAAIFAISGAILSGQLVLPWPKLTWFLAVFLPAIAVGIPAGQTNQSPGVIKATANDPALQVTSQDIKAADAAKAATSPPGM